MPLILKVRLEISSYCFMKTFPACLWYKDASNANHFTLALNSFSSTLPRTFYSVPLFHLFTSCTSFWELPFIANLLKKLVLLFLIFSTLHFVSYLLIPAFIVFTKTAILTGHWLCSNSGDNRVTPRGGTEILRSVKWVSGKVMRSFHVLV